MAVQYVDLLEESCDQVASDPGLTAVPACQKAPEGQCGGLWLSVSRSDFLPTILKTFPFGAVCLLGDVAPLESLSEPLETRIDLLDSIERRLRPRSGEPGGHCFPDDRRPIVVEDPHQLLCPRHDRVLSNAAAARFSLVIAPAVVVSPTLHRVGMHPTTAARTAQKTLECVLPLVLDASPSAGAG